MQNYADRSGAAGLPYGCVALDANEKHQQPLGLSLLQDDTLTDQHGNTNEGG